MNARTRTLDPRNTFRLTYTHMCQQISPHIPILVHPIPQIRHYIHQHLAHHLRPQSRTTTTASFSFQLTRKTQLRLHNAYSLLFPRTKNIPSHFFSFSSFLPSFPFLLFSLLFLFFFSFSFLLLHFLFFLFSFLFSLSFFRFPSFPRRLFE